MVMLGYRSTLARYSMVFVELQYLGTYLQETERPAVVQGKVFVVSLECLLRGMASRSRRQETNCAYDHGSGWIWSKVFEIVQYEGNCLPRLYMLVTVGVVSGAKVPWHACIEFDSCCFQAHAGPR